MDEEGLSDFIASKSGVQPAGVRIVKNKGIAYVDVFGDEEAQKILKISDKSMKFFISKPPEEDNDKKTAFIQHLPLQISEKEIHE